MASYDHPCWGLGFDWLAIDVNEHVALFSSAGYGQVPQAVLDSASAFDELSDALRRLPWNCQCVEQPAMPGDYSYWTSAAEKGLVAYDWAIWDGPYRRLTRPAVPIAVDSLPEHLVGLARLVRIGLEFENAEAIDLEQAGVTIAFQADESPG